MGFSLVWREADRARGRRAARWAKARELAPVVFAALCWLAAVALSGLVGR